MQTTVFYKDLIRSFRRAEGRINTFVTCYNEAQDLPLLKNTIITNNKHKYIDSKILPVIGWTRLHHVVYNFNLKTCKQFSEKCNLYPMNAGRIRKRLEKAIDPIFWWRLGKAQLTIPAKCLK